MGPLAEGRDRELCRRSERTRTNQTDSDRITTLHATELYHGERNHQGKDDLLLFPSKNELQGRNGSTVRCRQRLGGLLNFYAHAA